MTVAERVATAATAITTARNERDRAIVAMRAGGATLAAIAEAAGMTEAGVHKVLARMGPTSGPGTRSGASPSGPRTARTPR